MTDRTDILGGKSVDFWHHLHPNLSLLPGVLGSCDGCFHVTAPVYLAVRCVKTPNMVTLNAQVLHDAFLKNQTKPKLTGQGDLYYEGKEFEVCSKTL